MFSAWGNFFFHHYADLGYLLDRRYLDASCPLPPHTSALTYLPHACALTSFRMLSALTRSPHAKCVDQLPHTECLDSLCAPRALTHSYLPSTLRAQLALTFTYQLIPTITLMAWNPTRFLPLYSICRLPRHHQERRLVPWTSQNSTEPALLPPLTNLGLWSRAAQGSSILTIHTLLVQRVPAVMRCPSTRTT